MASLRILNIVRKRFQSCFIHILANRARAKFEVKTSRSALCPAIFFQKLNMSEKTKNETVQTTQTDKRTETDRGIHCTRMQYIFTTQTDNRTWTMDLLATDSQVRYCAYNNTIHLVPNQFMSIFRHAYFAVIKLCTKRLKYKPHLEHLFYIICVSSLY